MKKNSIKTNSKTQKQNKLRLEIAKAIREVKLMQEGKIKPLSLKDI